MSEPGHNSADARLRSFIDRVLRLKEEQDALADDIREVYAEAKGEGYDKTAMGALVSHLRKIEKKGADAVGEAETIFNLYLDAYQRAVSEPRTSTPMRAREIIEEFDAETGEITDNQDQIGGNGPDLPVEASTEKQAAGTSRPTHSHSQASPLKPADSAGEAPSSSQASPATYSDDGFDPSKITFLRKSAADYRPHCQKPEACGASGLRHCYTCQKAIDVAEMAEHARVSV